jgi:hypothetical protein
VIGLDLDRTRYQKVAPNGVGYSHPIARLEHAESNPLAVQNEGTVNRYIEGQHVAVDEHDQLAIDRIDPANHADPLQRLDGLI